MNDARKRREGIREKARKARFARFKREAKIKCEHGLRYEGMFCEKCNPALFLPPRLKACVYLKDEHSAVGRTRFMEIELPVDNLNTTMQTMHVCGFWAKDGNAALWFPPNSITRIIFWREDNDFGEIR